MMRIAYLLVDYVNSGGIERVIANKANYLVNHDYEIHIILLVKNKDQHSPFFTFDERIVIHYLDTPIRTVNKNLFIKKLSACLNEIKPDISISTGIGVLNYLYEVKDGSKKILELHFSKYKRKYKLANLDKYILGRYITSIYSFKRLRIARKYDKFVVLTKEDKESWGNFPNMEVIPNFVTFKPSNIPDLKRKKVIAIGRYTSQKGFDYLIDIWAKVCENHSDWILSIYGSGGNKTQLQEQIERLNLGNSVELLPPTKNIEKELINSSLFVMTSRYEGFPLALLEAMNCGLPSVTYACKCGPRDAIEDGVNGFLVDMGDKARFVQKMSLLMSDFELRRKMGHEASKSSDRFSQDRIMGKWMKLFDELAVDKNV